MILLVSKPFSYQLKRFRKKNFSKQDGKLWKLVDHLAYYIMSYEGRRNHSIRHCFFVKSLWHIQTKSGDIDI